MFLHESLNAEKFLNDKKLNLFKNGIINITQLVNLIEPTDGYVVFGPAILDKLKIDDFIIEWKKHQLNIENNKRLNFKSFSNDEIIQKIENVIKIFPELCERYNEFKQELTYSLCHACTKKSMISTAINIIKQLKDSRDLGKYKDDVDDILQIYDYELLNNSNLDLTNKYDIEWIQPESLIPLGQDIISKLDHCFECVIKHIGRAKILYEEFLLGYPEHHELCIEEIVAGNKNLEELYLKYMDSCAHMDMGSIEMAGDIVSLDKRYADKILNIANEIRKQRISFQNDINQVPKFDELRLEIKHLELAIKKDNKI